MDVASHKTSVFAWRLIAIVLVCLVWAASRPTPSAGAALLTGKVAHTNATSKAVTINVTSLYALQQDRAAVFRYNGTGTSWTKIGTEAYPLYGGGYGLFATNPTTGAIYRYNGTPGNWTKVGSAALMFAATDDALYGISLQDHQVWKYTGTGTTWIPMGIKASLIKGGGYGLCAAEEETIHLTCSNGTPGNWTTISWAYDPFFVSEDTVYSLSTNPTYHTVAQYSGVDEIWNIIRQFDKEPGADNLFTGGYGTFIFDYETSTLLRYGGTPETWLPAGLSDFGNLVVSDIAAYSIRTGPNSGVWKYSGSGTAWTKIGVQADSIAVAK